MTMHEVCARLGLTKKAVRYYVGEGLIAPRRLENGYADFSETDCETLERIALLRRLDLSIGEIRGILAGGSAETALHRLTKQIEREQTALRLLSGFSETRDYASLKRALTAEEQKRTIAERLESAFPGGFGRVVALMFAPYLSEPIETADQQAAFDEIIAFLDNVPAIDPALAQEMQRAFAPIDVYDAATYMAITALSEQSVAMGGLPQAFPDFTHGKWTSGRKICGGAYCLDRDGVF